MQREARNRPPRQSATARWAGAVAWFMTTGLFLAACGSQAEAYNVTLADLVRFADRYDGQRVSTAGRVRTTADPRHYWIEDDELNRVAIRPMDRVDQLVGQRVRVTGQFRYSRESGRLIRADQLIKTP